jgi:glycosyltransferase involved in cell wall biosynthesis
VRVVASSWSSNPRKGAETLAWLDRHLDFSRFDVTFVGQISRSFERVRVVGPLDSDGVARELRAHDVYLAASFDDPCSNALLEALACGLPAAYRHSGGHPELVGDAGVAFVADDELPAALDAVAADLEMLRRRIAVPAIADVADRYLAVLGLTGSSHA